MLDLDAAKGYDYARIGSVLNYLTREIFFTTHAFDMLKLNAAGFITHGIAQMQQSIRAHAYSTYNQNASSSSRATKFSVKTPLTRGGIEHHTTTSNSQLDTAKGMSLAIDAAYRGYELRLLAHIPEEVLYGCASPTFQEALTTLVKAQEVLAQPDLTEDDQKKAHQAWQKAYNDFTKDYGHGFVSGLKLISCAAGELQVTYESSGSQQQQRHGSSISGARKGIGASRAKDWAKEETKNKATGDLSSDAKALPAASPCATWVSNCMTSWASAGLKGIAAGPPPVPPAPSTSATAPDITHVDPPEKKTLPPVSLTNPDDMVKYMQYEQMQAEGFDFTKVDPAKGTAWEQYQRQIEDDTNQLNKDAVSQDGKGSGTSGSAWPDSDQRGVIGDGAGMADQVNDVDFGGYAIYDIEVTAYKDVFPSLNWGFHAAPSRTGLYLAKVHMFIMTRQLIGSYLTFLSSLPSEITGGWIGDEEAGVFGEVLTNYTTDVSNRFAEEPNWITSDGSYRDAVGRFRQLLSSESRFKTGMDIYDCFVANFKYLSNAPYGFLLTAKRDERTFYPRWGGWYIDSGGRLVSGVLSEWGFPAVNTGKLVEGSFRVFPIVVGRGEGHEPGIRLVIFVPENLLADGDERYRWYSWVSIQAKGVLEVSSRSDIWDFSAGSGGSGFGAKSRATYPNCGNELSVLISKGEQNPDSAWFGDKTTGQYDHLPVTLTPIDHKDVEYGTIHGIPMWYQLPFDLVKKSVLGGFGKEVKVED